MSIVYTCNALVRLIYSEDSGQYSYTILPQDFYFIFYFTLFRNMVHPYLAQFLEEFSSS